MEQPEGLVGIGDSLEVHGRLGGRGGDLRTWSRGAELAYLDPPFNTGRNFGSFDDRKSAHTWQRFLAQRLSAIRTVLADTGIVVVHIDATRQPVAHQVLVATLGARSYLNSVVWQRGRATGSARRRLSSTYEVLIFFGATPAASLNRIVIPHSPEYVAGSYTHRDEGGVFRFDTLTSSGPREGPAGRPWRGFDPSAHNVHWNVPRVPAVEGARRGSRSVIDRLDLLAGAGYVMPAAAPGGAPRFKRYLNNEGGTTLGDLWTDIPSLHSRSRERVGFPTQKPEALLERIITLTTQPGDLVVDPFAGSGTTAAAAHKMGRNWLTIEESERTVDAVIRPRLDRVIAGEDPNGITASQGWSGGGSYSVVPL